MDIDTRLLDHEAVTEGTCGPRPSPATTERSVPVWNAAPDTRPAGAVWRVSGVLT
jgi:hypothetical protein